MKTNCACRHCDAEARLRRAGFTPMTEELRVYMKARGITPLDEHSDQTYAMGSPRLSRPV